MRTIYVVDYRCEYRLHLEYERSKRSDCLLINLLFHQHGIIGFWEKKRIAFAVEITEKMTGDYCLLRRWAGLSSIKMKW